MLDPLLLDGTPTTLAAMSPAAEDASLRQATVAAELVALKASSLVQHRVRSYTGIDQGGKERIEEGVDRRRRLWKFATLHWPTGPRPGLSRLTRLDWAVVTNLTLVI